MKYRVQNIFMLDAICHQYYKGRRGAVEEVLKANPGLARKGPILPEGLVIELPDLAPPEDNSSFSLWE
ncbi:hypothetical protein GZ77_26545 [Endozoicomonas montiporae]|uniref:Phage tail protein n=1 Tax=Endozoicomonas montiporae TaxID=1027273 RepID=A0A081MYE8_9GAMM|nr:tail protein X [Endozoicomonas montiporae]KEQ11221.1 hypothetical protein GZ77_26545 [Endozoicomonas montiporae]